MSWSFVTGSLAGFFAALEKAEDFEAVDFEAVGLATIYFTRETVAARSLLRLWRV
ncbi:MAG: hypothetical protein LAT81_15900 [Oceanicaulis sp.]|nr:hypothetical protein [Oceanicaulis sp.]